MTVRISKPAINLRALLAKLSAIRPPARRETFWFTGNGSTTTFTLPRGWAPAEVHAPNLRRIGAGNDYTVAFDGFTYSVVFAVAPASGNVGIICTSEVAA